MAAIIALVAAVAARSIETLKLGFYEGPEATSDGVVCDACTAHDHSWGRPTVRHATADHVRYCDDLRAEMDAEVKAEMWAEGAWLRRAEEGTPDTWAEEDRAREMEALGYGPPPGF